SGPKRHAVPAQLPVPGRAELGLRLGDPEAPPPAPRPHAVGPETGGGPLAGGPSPLQLAMTLTQNTFLAKLAVTVAVFAAALTTFVLVNHGSSSSGGGSAGGVSVPPNASTDVRIAAYQQLVRTHPKDSRSYDY